MGRACLDRSCGGTAVTARDVRDHHSYSSHLADLANGVHSRLSNSAPAELGGSFCGACAKHHEMRPLASFAAAADDGVPEASRSQEPHQPQMSTTDSLASAASHHSLASCDSADELQVGTLLGLCFPGCSLLPSQLLTPPYLFDSSIATPGTLHSSTDKVTWGKQDASGLRTIRELQRGSSGVIVLAEVIVTKCAACAQKRLLPKLTVHRQDSIKLCQKHVFPVCKTGTCPMGTNNSACFGCPGPGQRAGGGEADAAGPAVQPRAAARDPDAAFLPHAPPRHPVQGV